jgi:hypothetical protein
LDFGAQHLETAAYPYTITRDVSISFIDEMLQRSGSAPFTLIILNNVRIRHNLPQDLLGRWLIHHHAVLFYLPPFSPELNLIEIDGQNSSTTGDASSRGLVHP